VNDTQVLWISCADALREQVSDAIWQAYLSGITPVSIKEHEIILGVPNKLIRDRVESRFLGLIQDTVVSYGPGDPLNRWYTNVGGAVEFTPLQPGNQFHGDLMLTYGSYNQKNLQFDVSSPMYKGWSTIFAGGLGNGDDFRNGPDGFGSPSKDLAFYDKTIKQFGQSSIDFGGYWAHSGGYRSQVIPTTPVAGINLEGPSTGAAYSQQSSGFFSTLPYANYNKYDVNEMGIAHVRENIHLSDNTQFENLSWFMHIRRLHDRLNDAYALGAQEDEWNNPHTDTYGDQFSLTRSLPMNLFTVTGYFKFCQQGVAVLGGGIQIPCCRSRANRIPAGVPGNKQQPPWVPCIGRRDDPQAVFWSPGLRGASGETDVLDE